MELTELRKEIAQKYRQARINQLTETSIQTSIETRDAQTQTDPINPPPRSSSINPPPRSSSINPPPRSSSINPPPCSSSINPPPRSSSINPPPRSSPSDAESQTHQHRHHNQRNISFVMDDITPPFFSARIYPYEHLFTLISSIPSTMEDVPTPVYHEYLQSLPTIQYIKKENDSEPNCVICQTEYQEGERLRLLPCMHRYHRSCIDEWFRIKNTCPICKRNINELMGNLNNF